MGAHPTTDGSTGPSKTWRTESLRKLAAVTCSRVSWRHLRLLRIRGQDESRFNLVLTKDLQGQRGRHVLRRRYCTCFDTMSRLRDRRPVACCAVDLSE